jgi:hypothetical protein
LDGTGSRSTPQDALHRLTPRTSRRDASGLQGTSVRLSRLHPHMGEVAEGQERGAANDGEEPPCPRAGRHQGMVSDKPPLARARPARQAVCEAARSLCLLRPGNIRQLDQYRQQVTKTWRKWLERRTRAKRLTWARFNTFLARHPLPRAKIIHRYATPSEALP